MTIETTTTVSITLPECQMMEKTFNLLCNIINKAPTNELIHKKAVEAADALAMVMDEIDEIKDC